MNEYQVRILLKRIEELSAKVSTLKAKNEQLKAKNKALRSTAVDLHRSARQYLRK